MKNTIETIIVPKDGCPLEEVARKVKEARNAWIFLNNEAIECLKKTHYTTIYLNEYTFNGNNRIVKVVPFNSEWMLLKEVKFGRGIEEFKEICKKPESVFYVEMRGQ